MKLIVMSLYSKTTVIAAYQAMIVRYNTVHSLNKLIRFCNKLGSFLEKLISFYNKLGSFSNKLISFYNKPVSFL